jgi:hypothetical protein
MRQQIEIELEEPEEDRVAEGAVEKLEPEEQARVSAGL